MTTQKPADATSSAAPFELRGSLFTLTILQLQSAELSAIDRHLEDKISQAPGFFQNAPVIIDLEKLSPPDASVDFVGLYDLLRNRGMIPVAIRDGDDAQRQAAALARLPSLPTRLPLSAEDSAGAAADSGDDNDGGDDTNGATPADATTATAGDSEAAVSYKLHRQPVRSGQQVYARGDLILLGPVSAGAEVVADGNIHAYAPLRGRALAGARGDTKARVFCHKLEAELVAIAGNYRVIEKDSSEFWQQQVQVYLGADDRLVIERLERPAR